MLSSVPETVEKVRMAGSGGGVRSSNGPFVVGLRDVTRTGQLSAAPVGDWTVPPRFI